MTSEPLISVIVPVYRAEAYLRNCVNSILCQTHRNIDLILVDDGSTDDCPAICDGYASADVRVRVIHQENKGVSAARNVGLDAARGDYIAFVDSDDWVEPDYLSYLLNILLDKKVLMAVCNHFVFARENDHAKYPVESKVTTLSRRASMEHLLYHLPPDASPWGKLYRRTVFEQLRYPENMIFEDTYLIADLVASAGEIAYGALPKYHYRFREHTLSKGALPDKSWHYLDAVDHLIGVVSSYYPDLAVGCTRRRVHAALSIRRLLVHAEASAKDDIARCLAIIRAGAKTVLRDKRAPMRDKAGILLALAGRQIFDSFWGFYGKIRSSY